MTVGWPMSAFMVAAILCPCWAAEAVIPLGRVDAGIVFPGQASTGTHPFTNSTTETLRLVDITRSCACTKAELSARELAPGASALLSFGNTWPLQHGPGAVSIGLRFADAKGTGHGYALDVEYRVLDYLELIDGSDRILLSPVQSGDSEPVRVNIPIGSHPDVWDAVTVSVSAPGISAAAEMVAGKAAVEVAFTNRRTILGPFTADVAFAFSNGGTALTHTVHRKLCGRTSGPIEARPSVLSLGIRDARLPITDSITLRGKPGEILVFHGASVEGSNATLAIDPSLITTVATGGLLIPLRLLPTTVVPSGTAVSFQGAILLEASTTVGRFTLRVPWVGGLR